MNGPLAAYLRERAFSLTQPRADTALRIGAEIELIPVIADTGAPCPVDGVEGERGPALLPFLRAWSAANGWLEWKTGKGVPGFCTPDGGRITFEPGGQVEYSAPPAASATALLASLRALVVPLRAAAADAGIDLLSLGIDPANGDGATPLQLRSERYDAMAAYFATVGTGGARMMRQTASVQVCLDVAGDAELQWRVLNAAAPVVVAIFANSPRYAGALSDEQSVRAGAWRALDPRRTGLPFGEPAGEAYLRFALDAPSIFHRAPDGSYAPFGELLASGRVATADWDTHLSTLFPEVRPRGYLELRSADAVDPEHYAAPLALLAGICYHAPSLRAAADLLGAPSEPRLAIAGRAALRDPALARDAEVLAEIALAGCRALGDSFFAPADLERARDFFDRYTRAGRSPADDARERAASV